MNLVRGLPRAATRRRLEEARRPFEATRCGVRAHLLPDARAALGGSTNEASGPPKDFRRAFRAAAGQNRKVESSSRRRATSGAGKSGIGCARAPEEPVT